MDDQLTSPLLFHSELMTRTRRGETMSRGCDEHPPWQMRHAAQIASWFMPYGEKPPNQTSKHKPEPRKVWIPQELIWVCMHLKSSNVCLRKTNNQKTNNKKATWCRTVRVKAAWSGSSGSGVTNGRFLFWTSGGRTSAREDSRCVVMGSRFGL